LGCTEGGVRVAFTTDVSDLMCDQWGTQPYDQMITGQGARVTVPLAEYTLENLALALNQELIADALIEGERLVGTKNDDPWSESVAGENTSMGSYQPIQRIG